jgi:hypothetical protein
MAYQTFIDFPELPIGCPVEVPKNSALTKDTTRNKPNGVYFATDYTSWWWDAVYVETNATLPDDNPNKKFKEV